MTFHLKRAWLILSIATVIGVAAVAVASQLELRTSFAELLPSKDPAVVVLRENAKRLHDLGPLMIAIQSPDHAANLRYADLLTRYLRALPSNVCALAAYEMRETKAFMERNAWLYASLEDLTRGRDRLRAKILSKKNPLALDLEDDEPASLSDAVKQRLPQNPLEARFPDGTFSQGDFTWVVALPSSAGGIFQERAGEPLVRAVQSFIAQTSPAGFHPNMHVTLAGPVMVALESRQAVEQDVAVVSTICVLVIGLAIALFFRSLWSIPFIVIPAGLGAALAFAAEQLTAGYLNSSTAFLGSIIVGNGINHGIVLLARFQELSREGRLSVEERLRRAMCGVWKSTLIAAIAAAIGYCALALTSFRGFSQFGLMGAVGSLGCWLATFTVLPALLRLFDRRLRSRMRAPVAMHAFGRFLERRYIAVATGAVFVSALSIAGFRHFLHDPFEYDFRQLRADAGVTVDRQAADGNLLKVFGHWYSPTPLLAQNMEQVPLIAKAVRQNDNPDRPRIGHVVTIFDVLPGTQQSQTEKLNVLAGIRALFRDPALRLLPDDEWRTLMAFYPPDDLRVLQPADLPAMVRYPFTETDGTIGKVVLAYHADDISMWDGKELLRVASALETLPLADGTTLRSSGQPMVLAAMLRSILRDAPLSTGLAFVGLTVLLALIARPRKLGLLALASVTLGVVWMIGSAGIVGVRVTFLNFIAIPITFGVGVEYALNMVSRLSYERHVASAVGTTGAAVILCSFTTIVGYGSLLAASSQALRGFGAMAILGEVFCLATAVVAVPVAVFAWRRRRSPEVEAHASLLRASQQIVVKQ